MAKGTNSATSSPKAVAPISAPVSVPLDMSFDAWLKNISLVLKSPATILTVAGLLVIGAFAETAPRKSLEFLNNSIGNSIFFILPLLIAFLLDWATGLLAAAISLIVFARLQREDSDEGFMDTDLQINSDIQTTKLVSNPHRWFVEKILGERPIAIASDRIITGPVRDEDNRTSSSSSMATSGLSDSSNHR